MFTKLVKKKRCLIHMRSISFILRIVLDATCLVNFQVYSHGKIEREHKNMNQNPQNIDWRSNNGPLAVYLEGHVSKHC